MTALVSHNLSFTLLQLNLLCCVGCAFCAYHIKAPADPIDDDDMPLPNPSQQYVAGINRISDALDGEDNAGYGRGESINR